MPHFFRSNGIVSAPMWTYKVIETNRYTFPPNAERDRRMRANGRSAGATSRVIGYARVATEEQGTDPQPDELRAADCDAVCEEHTPSGADRTRPALARLLREIRSCETLVVVRLDHPARSVCRLFSVIEQLEAMVHISAVCATRSTPQRHKACSHCRCWAASPSSSGR
jgi:hypothetical protein